MTSDLKHIERQEARTAKPLALSRKKRQRFGIFAAK